ncbi:MAG: sigma-70 family RNA polymerase sigma factor [Myxococcota bacterium]
MSLRRPTLAEIFRDHAAFVLRVVRRFGAAEADVEDVAQEVFLVLHRRLADYDPERPIRPWIYAIAFRVTSDARRKTQRAATLRAPTPEPEVAPDRALELQHARRLLDEALDSLSADARFVFVGYELEGMSMKEIAEAANAPLQTCYSRLHSARARVIDFVRQRSS